jgi:16S rRNA (cytosine1402-N4)-methyltransferase
MSSVYHVPVMPDQCIEGLHIRPDGVYVDVTFGGGGHSRAILNQLTTGKLLAFDQDADARQNADALQAEFQGRSFTFIASNFRHLKRYLKFHKVTHVDGILADLGISSHQIDEGARGFSTRYDGPLDMRMDQQGGKSAADVVNTYEEKDLIHVLSYYGEIKNARTLAQAIVKARQQKRIETSGELRRVVEQVGPRGKINKYLAQVYQAIRIEVNEELEALKEFLEQSAEVLKPGGRLVVMSYHSLEDRLVKNFMNKGNFRGKDEKDFYGNLLRPLTPVTRKPVEADVNELERNPRARSARLRVAEKN